FLEIQGELFQCSSKVAQLENTYVMGNVLDSIKPNLRSKGWLLFVFKMTANVIGRMTGISQKKSL
ncbi:Uncharacterized protein APZ42_004482, partial [Daphnia magna]